MWGSIISAVAPAVIGAIAGGGGGGSGGGGSGGGGQTGAGLIRAIQAGQQQSLLQERPLEEIEPAASAKERGEYLMRMLQAIQNNETEGASAMDSVAASLMRDMQAGTGRIQEEPIVQPQEPSVPKVEAVKLPELEQEKEEEEPFVRRRSDVPSLFG